MHTILETIDKKQLKKILLYVFIVGLISHGYCYFNSNFSHDALTSFNVINTEHMLQIGRFIRPLYQLIRGKFTLPVINGFLSLLYFSFVVYFVVDLLQVKSNLSIFFISAILVTNYSVSLLNASYLHDADSYILALLFSCFAFWLYRNKVTSNKLFIIVFYVLSMGLYQAYINVPITLILMLGIKDLLEKKDYKIVLKEVIEQLIIIMISMIIYYVIYKLCLLCFGVLESTEYNSVERAFVLSFNEIGTRLYRMVESEAAWFVVPKGNNKIIECILNIFLLSTGLIMIIRQIKINSLSKKSIILLVVFILAMPFGINAITFISGFYHDLTIYSFFFLYIFVILLIENTRPYIYIYKAVYLIFFVIIFYNCVFSNECYLKKDIESQSTISIYTRIIDRIEQIKGYEVGKTEVFFIGDLDKVYESVQIGFDSNATGLYSKHSTTYIRNVKKYINEILGVDMNVSVDETKIAQISELEQVKELDVFPSVNSISMIDDYIVVKFLND